jgi:V/A-type H+/Na+-transporting ATPase subunit I
MFFPREMVEIELIVPSKDLLAVTKVLSGYGVFHQTDSNYPGVASGSANTWQETAAQYAALERRIQTVMQALGIDEGQPPASAGQRDAMAEIEKIRPMVEQIEEEVRSTNDELSEQRKRLEQLESILHQLEPVEDVDIDISSLRDSRYMFSMLGLIPAANMERLQTSLARTPHVFLTLRSDPGRPVVWLAGTKANSDVLQRAARSAYLDPLVLPSDYQGTPGNIIQSLRNTIESTQRRIDELQATLSRLGEERKQQLRDLLWQTHTARVLSEAIVRFGQLRHTYVVTGWVPADKLEDLTHRLKQAAREILIETLPTSRSGHNQNVPVVLTSNKFLRPFQLLVNTYARPQYGEFDPTILIAITFPLLFGAMFGDVGQGLVLVLLGWLLSSKIVKRLRGMASFGGLITVCGVMATIFGFLYGSVFGFEGVLHPIWAPPLENILQILAVTIGGGAILLSIGFLIGIFNLVISREWSHLIFGHNGIAGLVLYWSFFGFAAAAFGILPIPSVIFIILIVIAAVAVMFSDLFINLFEGHRPLVEGSPALYFLLQAPMELFEVVISLFSNTFSYARVAAFAIVHTGLSLAIFAVAGLGPHNWIGSIIYWTVVILGNILVIVGEGVIVGIQTMRLSYYELFSKFFRGGGMRFEPLTLNPAEEE